MSAKLQHYQELRSLFEAARTLIRGLKIDGEVMIVYTKISEQYFDIILDNGTIVWFREDMFGWLWGQDTGDIGGRINIETLSPIRESPHKGTFNALELKLMWRELCESGLL